ncbi:zinc finger protein 106-like [Seriola dumerili]|uniref:zinc finger protein 106-like n=1 Tax=Seriola dumerili TaxID=41447 RepID=UPI000BBEED9C|nr:zinc finger protein 106-like [Seriola dumerili]
MATVHTSQEMVDKPPVKNKGYKQRVRKRKKSFYCILCRRKCLRYEAQEHMHSMLHHQELETVLGKDSFHECQACEVFSMGLHDQVEELDI